MNKSSHWVNRLGVVAGSLGAITMSPIAGKAAVVKVTGSPVSLHANANSTAYWDVDGDGSNDFRLWNRPPYTTYYGGQVPGGTVFFGSNGSIGRGLVAPFKTDAVIALPISFNVGPTLNQAIGSYNPVWGPGFYQSRNAMSGGGSIGYDFNYGFQQGDNYFGFRFDKSGALHYGFGVINFDSPNKLVTIKSWVYDTVADRSVHVEVSGPSEVPGPSGLLGLAAGAGWVRKMRRRVKAAQ